MKDAMKDAEDCIFCKIAGRKIPADIIKETAHFIVIKDINPVAPVHLLIISKRHFDSLLDIEDEDENENENRLLRYARNDVNGARNDVNGNEVDGIGGSEVFRLIGKLAEEFNVEDKGFRTVINTKEDGGQTVNHLHIHFMAGRRFGWPPG